MDFKNYLKLKQTDTAIPKLPVRKLKEKEYCIFVDSRDRNRTNYPSSASFIVKINSGNNTSPTINFKYRNIKNIYLSKIVLPKNVVSYPYLIIDIPELSTSKTQGTNNNLNKSFCIVVPETHHNDGDFVNCTIEYIDPTSHVFEPFMATMPNILTIKIKTPSGTIVNLGVDNLLPNAPKGTVQSFMTFKVICMEEDNNILNSMAIY